MLKSVAIHFMKTRTLGLCSFSKALTCEHTRDGTSPFIILIIELCYFTFRVIRFAKSASLETGDIIITFPIIKRGVVLCVAI